jgi:uncharacterized protein
MSTRFLVFLSVVATVLGLSAYYVGDRFIAWSAWAGAHRGVVWMTLALVVGLQFLGPYLYRVVPDRTNRLFVVHWITYVTLGVLASVTLYTAFADALAVLVTAFAPAADAANLEPWVVGGLLLGTITVGTVQAARGPRVYRVEIPIANLPPAFDGFRIVQLTDVHLGPTLGRRFLEKAVATVNALAPDVAALTGDFVDGSVAQLREATAPLAAIRARDGAFFVAGNHEYYWGAPAWIEEFRRLGARPLLNEHVVVNRGGEILVLAGVTDFSAGHMVAGHASDPAKALHGAPPDAARVVLAHHPASYKAIAAVGADLQLSGHTHGGQFFPFSVLVRLTHRYYKGLRRHGRLWIYVSRGAGYWGPPLRFAVPAEITLVVLRRG